MFMEYQRRSWSSLLKLGHRFDGIVLCYSQMDIDTLYSNLISDDASLHRITDYRMQASAEMDVCIWLLSRGQSQEWIFWVPTRLLFLCIAKVVPNSKDLSCAWKLKWTFVIITGEAESGLERLHQCAEKDLQVFFPYSKLDNLEDHPSAAVFGDFRIKLVGLTRYYRLIVFVSSFTMLSIYYTHLKSVCGCFFPGVLIHLSSGSPSKLNWTWPSMLEFKY